MKRKYLVLAFLISVTLVLSGCFLRSKVPPGAPSNLTATVISYSQINLTWKDNSADETGFYIYRKNTNSYSNIANIQANTTFYNDTGLSPGTTYSYKVCAYNNGGESGSSNEVTITTPGEPTAPSAPSNLAGQAVSFSEIDLTWQDNSTNEEGFYVYRKTTDNYSIIATMEANATSYNNTNLSPETAYSYKITAYNDSGESESSNAICITTPGEGLKPPTNVEAIAVNFQQINLTWQDNSDDEDNFRIACDMGLGPGNNEFLVRLPADTIHYEHCDLKPLTRYQYFVITERSGESASSERVAATTPEFPVEILDYELKEKNGYAWVTGHARSNINEIISVTIKVWFYDSNDVYLDYGSCYKSSIPPLATWKFDSWSDYKKIKRDEVDHVILEVTSVWIY